jgi:DnaJ like chaperone protein
MAQAFGPEQLSELRKVVADMLAGPQAYAREVTMLPVLFYLLGQLSAIDGDVAPEEIALVHGALDELALDRVARDIALRSFDAGRAEPRELRGEVARFLADFPPRSNEAATLYGYLLRLALADGRVHERERAFLVEVTGWLGYAETYLDWKLEKLTARHRAQDAEAG